MIAAGVDIGSSGAKAVILEDGEIVSAAIIPTGIDSAETANQVLDEALKSTKLQRADLDRIVSTGYGRVNVPFADKNITEISCHARGIVSVFPSVRTILDMGGQDCKAIKCNEQGRVQDFIMNEKCAAGTGRYLERLSAVLGVALPDIGPKSMEIVTEPSAISNYCAVFAEGDAVMLLRQGEHVNDILAGVCDALAERIQLLIKRIGIVKDFSITGGIAKNIGVVKRLEILLDTEAKIAPDPQIIGALGAAHFAANL